ncbi:Alpha-1,3-mannosyl-glycoprotein, partial [Euroglyphus maynei]
MSTLLDNDERIYCISAWNDNGKDHLIDHSAISLLYLTDFFPGLGWMLKRSLWYEIRDKWPISFWDDWLRHPDQRKERLCVRPELSRTSTSGMKGVSRGQYYKQHLSFIHHSNGYYPFFEHQNIILDQLNSKNYEHKFLYQVYNKSEEIHPVALKIMDPNY